MSSEKSELEKKDKLIVELQSRLDEAEETLFAIQNGEIDAIITPQGSDGPKVYTLESADSLYRNLVQEMNEGVATLTTDGTIIYGNSQLASMLQLPMEKLIGQRLNDFILYGDREIYNSILEKGLTSRSHGEIHIMSNINTIIPVSISANTIKDFKGIYVVIANLSEHKHHELLKIAHEELKERNDKFEALFENSMDAVLLTIADGTILDANVAAEKMFGYTKEEMLKLGRKGIVDTNDPNLSVLLDERNRTGKTKGELKLKRKNGTIFPTEITSNVYDDIKGNKRTSMIIRDITLRKQAEEDLHKYRNELESLVMARTSELQNAYESLKTSQEHYLTLFNSIDEGFCTIEVIFDDNKHPIDYRFLEVNPAFEKQTGLLEAKGRLIRDMTSDNEDYWYEIYGNVALTGKPHRFINEAKAMNRWYDVYAFKVGETESHEVAILFNDITQFKETEKKLKEYQHTLEEKVEKRTLELTRSNSELEHFAYVASHDLREPLRMITSFLQLLEKQYTDKLDQNAHEYIDFAVDGAKRLDNMINDLLEYSQVKSAERELVPVNTEEVLEETLINLKIPIEESKAIITHDSLPTIIGDKEILVQLFQNLISNSIKYRSDETPKIYISAKEEQNNHRFSVQDNGIGMSVDHLERIFTIFQRLHSKEEYEGTGIGLAIAQKIVHQLGGHIWVESEIGKGSTFYFTIPNRDGEYYTQLF